jgi:acyl carrier protein
MTPPDLNDIVTRVSRRVAEVLALEVSEVRADSRLMEDLGADSLDLVELMYLLEQEFDITLDKNDMSLTAQLGLAEEEIHSDEVLTPLALERLRERFPWAGEILVEGITRKHLGALVTVETFARAIERKL